MCFVLFFYLNANFVNFDCTFWRDSFRGKEALERVKSGEKYSERSASSYIPAVPNKDEQLAQVSEQPKWPLSPSPHIHQQQTWRVTDGKRERCQETKRVCFLCVTLLVVILSGIQELTFSFTSPHLSVWQAFTSIYRMLLICLSFPLLTTGQFSAMGAALLLIKMSNRYRSAAVGCLQVYEHMLCRLLW